MQASEYQKWCRRFDNHLPSFNSTALALGLCSEAGEVAGEYEKWCRKGEVPEFNEFGERVALELGDVLWNVARLADELGYSLEDLFQMNINKLIARHGADDG